MESITFFTFLFCSMGAYSSQAQTVIILNIKNGQYLNKRI